MAVLLVLIFSVSCRDATPSTAEDAAVNKTESHHSEDELRLNNAEKWKANIETTKGVLAMQKHMDDFRNSENRNYNQLKSQLELEFKTIFEKCTMKGESHEQLHNFLFPMRAYFSALSNDSETAEAAYVQLDSYLPIYFEYFE